MSAWESVCVMLCNQFRVYPHLTPNVLGFTVTDHDKVSVSVKPQNKEDCLKKKNRVLLWVFFFYLILQNPQNSRHKCLYLCVDLYCLVYIVWFIMFSSIKMLLLNTLEKKIVSKWLEGEIAGVQFTDKRCLSSGLDCSGLTGHIWHEICW